MAEYGLIADIGGTNARFALADEAGYYEEKVLKCADFDGPTEAVRAYLETLGQKSLPRRGAFALAGPITGDVFTAANLPWTFSISETAKILRFEQFGVYNDFEAVAMAIPFLKEGEREQIGPGKPKEHAPIGVLGPGTGLGVASVVWTGSAWKALPGEGGHVTAPAKSQREFDVVNALYKKYRHISAERVCSGKGLVNLYNALRMLEWRDDAPDRTPEEISAAALSGECSLCAEALDMMMGYLGRIAGNLALTIGAHGGIYIAGGIVGGMSDYLKASRFREEFEAKGPLQEFVAQMPTYLIRHPYPAFLGLQSHLMGL